MNVLLVHVKRNLLPDRVRMAPGINQLSVITEAGHRQQYGPDVDVRLVDNVLDVDSVRGAALELMRERTIDRILSPFELGMSVAGYLRSYFGIPGMGYDTANAFSNKYVMKQRLAAAGIPVAGFRVAHGLRRVPEAASALGWPVIVKPIYGGGSENVCVFVDITDFQDFCSSPAAAVIESLGVPLLVEQFMDVADEYHCDGIIDDGEVLLAVPSRYFVPTIERKQIFGTHTLPPHAVERAGILSLHSQAVRALGLEAGPTHMELLKTPQGILVGEIACRPGGMGIVDAVELQTGVNIWDGFVDTSLGLTPKINSAPRDDIVAHLRLPVKPGRISRLSDAADLAALPGVIKVDMKRTVGDLVEAQPRFGSGHGSGLVYFVVRDVTELDGVIHRIHDRYEFAVEDDSVGDRP